MDNLRPKPTSFSFGQPTAQIRNPFVLERSMPLGADFLATLPVLVAFPILALTATFSVLPNSTYEAVPARLAVLVLQASVVLASARLFSGERATSVATFAGLLLSFASLLFLPATRTAVVFFGLYLNSWNPYTLVAFIYDLYECEDMNSSLSTASGYLCMVLGYWLVLKKGTVLSNSAIYSTLGVSALFGVVFWKYLSIPLLLMNVAAAVLLLFLVKEARLRSHVNVAAIAMFTYFLETFVLKTSRASFFGIIVSVVLPLLIQIDHNPEFEVVESAPLPHILSEVLSHSDTRAIFNFLLLNTAFMFVQLLYSFRLKLLGLLSDSLHMALDCASLALGLIAGILLKHPINNHGKYPFGLRNFEILAGFTNGTLLVGISGSIIFEAVGRLFNPVALQQTTELIVVSILGLLVNVVGIFAFNHGHGHGHSHGPAPEAAHESHEHSGHSHGHSHSHSHQESSHAQHESSCEDEGMNDNMRGIFLHILADTLGLVGVVISTVLTKLFLWQGFDPVALIIIAVLIFFTAVPLMKSTASTLLLKLDRAREGSVRSALNDLTTIKGIKSFTTPRFWPTGKKLRGYIHIQIYRGENGAYLKKQCEEVFKKHSIEAMMQMENDFDPCWCRETAK